MMAMVAGEATDPATTGNDVDEEPLSTERSERVGRYSLEGLAQSWDNDEYIRNRLRSGRNLCMHWDPTEGKLTDQTVVRSIQNVRMNSPILAPVCKLMAANECTLPMIDGVMEEVRSLFMKAKVPIAGDRIYHESWAVRRLLSLLKSLTWKGKYPKDRGTKQYSDSSFHSTPQISIPQNCPRSQHLSQQPLPGRGASLFAERPRRRHSLCYPGLGVMKCTNKMCGEWWNRFPAMWVVQGKGAWVQTNVHKVMQDFVQTVHVLKICFPCHQPFFVAGKPRGCSC